MLVRINQHQIITHHRWWVFATIQKLLDDNQMFIEKFAFLARVLHYTKPWKRIVDLQQHNRLMMMTNLFFWFNYRKQHESLGYSPQKYIIHKSIYMRLQKINAIIRHVRIKLYFGCHVIASSHIPKYCLQYSMA